MLIPLFTVALLLVVAPLGWLLRDYRRYLAYRLRVAELLAEAGLDPAHFNEVEIQRLENAVRRGYFKWRPHLDVVTAVLAAASKR